jgi:hypothetical protein
VVGSRCLPVPAPLSGVQVCMENLPMSLLFVPAAEKEPAACTHSFCQACIAGA